MRLKATVKAVNELAKQESGRIKDLLDAGARVAHAQTQALRGKADAGALRDAGRELGQMVDELTGRAEDLMETKTNQAARRTIAQTLRAAATGGDIARELLRRGELTRDLEPESVFGLPGDLPPAPKARKLALAEQKEIARLAHEHTKRLQKIRAAEAKATQLERLAQQFEQAAWRATRKRRKRAIGLRQLAMKLKRCAQRQRTPRIRRQLGLHVQHLGDGLTHQASRARRQARHQRQRLQRARVVGDRAFVIEIGGVHHRRILEQLKALQIGQQRGQITRPQRETVALVQRAPDRIGVAAVYM
jgi:hypothetical protein